MTIIEQAKKFAQEKHQGQFDKAKEDYYLAHVEVVAKKVENAGYPMEYIVTAYLHDVVEDTGTTIEEIAESFGDGVSLAVQALTKYQDEDYDTYINRLQKNKIATVVKYFDMTHNSDLSRLKQIRKKDLDRKEKYAKHMKELHQNINIIDENIQISELTPFYQTNMYIQAEYAKLIWKRFNWFLAIEAALLSLYFSKHEGLNELIEYLPLIGLFIALLWLAMGVEDQKSMQKHKNKGKRIEKIILYRFFSFPQYVEKKNSILKGLRQTSLLWIVPLLLIVIWVGIVCSG